MSDLATIRRAYAHSIAADVGVTNAAVIEAFARVPREDFLGAGPWLLRGGTPGEDTRTSDPSMIYRDVLVALDADKGINNGQPSLHARSIAAAAPVPGERVIHVGAGTGYYTAILAHIVGPSGRVMAYEIDRTLADRASTNLRPYPTVTVIAGSAIAEPLTEADVIYASAAVCGVPAAWLDALAVGGRLIVPMMPVRSIGHMWRIWRIDTERFAAGVFSRAVFIGCAGAQDVRESAALAAALARSGPEQVRSLRREEPPDATAWVVGKGWWLSTAEP